MAKKKKPKFNPDKALLKNSTYATKSVLKQGAKKGDSAKKKHGRIQRIKNLFRKRQENGKD